jgi:hypothetical protein
MPLPGHVVDIRLTFIKVFKTLLMLVRSNASGLAGRQEGFQEAVVCKDQVRPPKSANKVETGAEGQQNGKLES